MPTELRRRRKKDRGVSSWVVPQEVSNAAANISFSFLIVLLNQNLDNWPYEAPLKN
jgi:hypothetical protein